MMSSAREKIRPRVIWDCVDETVEEEVFYRRGPYAVSFVADPRSPSTVRISVWYIYGGPDSPSKLWSEWAITGPPPKRRWWQSRAHPSFSDAVTRAQALVDFHVDNMLFTEEQIKQKVEELRLREQAIQELEVGRHTLISA